MGKALSLVRPEIFSILCDNTQELITVSDSNYLRFWDIAHGCEIGQVNLGFAVEGISVLEKLALVHGSSDIVIMSIAKRQVIFSSQLDNEIISVDFLGGSPFGFVITFDNEVRIYLELKCKQQFVIPHDLDNHYPLISEDGKFIVVFNVDNFMCIWNTLTGKMLWQKRLNGISLASLINQDKYISFCNDDNSVTLLELASGTEIFHKNLGTNIINICPILSQKQ